MKSNALITSSARLSISSVHSVSDIRCALNDIEHLYPNFDAWLKFKFQKGNLAREHRKILVAHKSNEIMGLSLLKNQNSEKKICTFYVLPDFREMGVGRTLMQSSLDWLRTDKPIISVSEERLASLLPLFERYNFCLSDSKNNYYRKGKLEHFFNLAP